MVRRRSTVRFRKGAPAHRPGRRRLTCVNAVRRRLRVLRLATAETGSLRLVAPNTRPSLSFRLLPAASRPRLGRAGRPARPVRAVFAGAGVRYAAPERIVPRADVLRWDD